MIQTIARKIPDKARIWILETNAIFKAIANNTDPHMKGLLAIWDTYIDKLDKKEFDCSWCMARIHQNFINLQDSLIEIEREKKLLDL
jgi:hypothetical protein